MKDWRGNRPVYAGGERRVVPVAGPIDRHRAGSLVEAPIGLRAGSVPAGVAWKSKAAPSGQPD